jgi:hypothetical protein
MQMAPVASKLGSVIQWLQKDDLSRKFALMVHVLEINFP